MFRSYAFSLMALVAASGAALAQPLPGVAGTNPPVFSPYLNLARRDSSPAINYFGLVRPQIQARSSLLALQNQLQQENQRQMSGQSVVNPDLPVTGQQTVFLNTGGYFMNSGLGIGPSVAAYSSRRTLPSPFTPTSAFDNRTRTRLR